MRKLRNDDIQKLLGGQSSYYFPPRIEFSSFLLGREKAQKQIQLILPAPLCPVAPEDGTGVGRHYRTGVNPVWQEVHKVLVLTKIQMRIK